MRYGMVPDLVPFRYCLFPTREALLHARRLNIECCLHPFFPEYSQSRIDLAQPRIVETEAYGRPLVIGPLEVTGSLVLSGFCGVCAAKYGVATAIASTTVEEFRTLIPVSFDMRGMTIRTFAAATALRFAIDDSSH
jgi:hypothetical protein